MFYFRSVVRAVEDKLNLKKLTLHLDLKINIGLFDRSVSNRSNHSGSNSVPAQNYLATSSNTLFFIFSAITLCSGRFVRPTIPRPSRRSDFAAATIENDF